jgi:acetolactate decarboxylase
MKTISFRLPTSVYDALEERVKTDKVSFDHVTSMALAHYLGKPIHTLFQVSMSAALVEGLYQGAVRVSRLLRHGDFGLGTFVDLDGEMVILDGICYRVAPTGRVTIVPSDRLVPYAVVTRFTPDISIQVQRLKSFAELTAVCDRLRDSQNAFYAFRVEGRFSFVKTRLMKAVHEGTELKGAAARQKEFDFEYQQGTLIGLWSPGFAETLSISGYHFHFLSTDRTAGGHVLKCKMTDVRITGCALYEMHVSLPETAEFLRADLNRDPNDDLMSTEQHNEA